MGEAADREAFGDVAEDSGSYGDQVQAVFKRRHDARPEQDRDTGGDRQRGGVDRLLQDARVLREGEPQVSADLAGSADPKLDEVSRHGRFRRGGIAFQLHRDRRQSQLHAGSDGL